MSDGYRIELFVFPDGTAVEMVVYDDGRRRPVNGAGAAPPAPPRSARTHAACRVPPPPSHGREPADACPVCGGRLVHPVERARVDDASWRVRLRCPDCETHREVVLSRSGVERLEREQYHGARALAREVERLSRRNFEDAVETIVRALELDLIQPTDF